MAFMGSSWFRGRLPAARTLLVRLGMKPGAVIAVVVLLLTVATAVGIAHPHYYPVGYYWGIGSDQWFHNNDNAQLQCGTAYTLEMNVINGYFHSPSMYVQEHNIRIWNPTGPVIGGPGILTNYAGWERRNNWLLNTPLNAGQIYYFYWDETMPWNPYGDKSASVGQKTFPGAYDPSEPDACGILDETIYWYGGDAALSIPSSPAFRKQLSSWTEASAIWPGSAVVRPTVPSSFGRPTITASGVHLSEGLANVIDADYRSEDHLLTFTQSLHPIEFENARLERSVGDVQLLSSANVAGDDVFIASRTSGGSYLYVVTSDPSVDVVGVIRDAQ